MAKLSITITHVAWRDGRPRFQPGPKIRALGFKGQDLRHGTDGPWFSPAEAKAWADEREKEIASRRAAAAVARASGKRYRPKAAGPLRHAGAGLSVEDLFELYFASPRMKGQAVQDGKRHQKAASPLTVRDYRKKADALGRFDGTIYTAPVDALNKPILFDLYERMWTKLGLATARGTIAVLSSAISWGMKRGHVRLAVNPCLGLGMEMPDARLRCLTPGEVRHLVAAADITGRPEIGDAIVLGVWTGQRQNDRLALMDAGLFDGRRLFRQSKTKAIVEIVESPELEARLAAARSRRQSWPVQPVEIIVDEVQRAPFRADHYRHTFAAVRAAAVAGVKDAATGAQLLEPMPGLADARDQDLRDTAVTWLGRAGCTHPEIAQITGHSMQSVQTVLKHYLSSHREIADNAITKLVTWYEAEGQQI